MPEEWVDPDILAMKLDDGEKSGLQIYRNYTRAFEKSAIDKFVQQLDLEELDLGDLSTVIEKVASEDARYVPVIVCAFADDVLKGAFKAALPDGIPGGKAAMLSGYGPLSDFAKRIQLAYAFDVLSADLMTNLDHVRSVRNKLSHSWDINDVKDFFEKGRLADMYPVEKLLLDHEQFPDVAGPFEPIASFRIRMAWVLARLVYEAAAYGRAKALRLKPSEALYRRPPSKWLRLVSKIALDATLRLVA
ncbi:MULTISPECIES: hypothetical protein [unclassified Mesorhizobium]|uniref:hypothetical protein n=1 Tax=unclassified Mesorhizobium TaxID=325217 RepID=UPI0033381631